MLRNVSKAYFDTPVRGTECAEYLATEKIRQGYCLLERGTVETGKKVPTFRRNLMPPSECRTLALLIPDYTTSHTLRPYKLHIMYLMSKKKADHFEYYDASCLNFELIINQHLTIRNTTTGSLSSPSSTRQYYCCCHYLSPLYRVFTIIYLKQTVFLRYIVLQLFSSYDIQYMLHVMLFPTLNVLYFTPVLPAVLCSVAVCCSALMCFDGTLLGYFVNGFEMVPVAPIITGITFVFTFHIRCISSVKSSYFRIFSFLITLLLLLLLVVVVVFIRWYVTAHKTFVTFYQTGTWTGRHSFNITLRYEIPDIMYYLRIKCLFGPEQSTWKTRCDARNVPWITLTQRATVWTLPAVKSCSNTVG